MSDKTSTETPEAMRGEWKHKGWDEVMDVFISESWSVLIEADRVLTRKAVYDDTACR